MSPPRSAMNWSAGSECGISWLGAIKLFSCSTQLSMKVQLFINTKKFLDLSPSDVGFIMLINVKMPTIVGILTFKSRINFVPS